ncbi:MPN domain-containing protein [Pontibacter pudoricolor]|uniref:Mov34/MPN/PAD-1 family protein n=1 Tax=Pontibacter pudoricolor TaxID=2694930 RepID=UPI0013912C99|nr:Mov34/MPN/PAD-1 family protein [Pontibacter pudoricolor]
MEPIGLMHIETVLIPREFIDSVYKEFQDTGQEGFERLALFAGKKSGPEFSVTHLLYPKQQLLRTPEGLSFQVDGEELERINEWLFQNSYSLIAQIHSHPSEAYHSEADDALAIITTFGGLSIVVPDYGFSDKNLAHSAFYRLLPDTGWTELSPNQVTSLIKITD